MIVSTTSPPHATPTLYFNHGPPITFTLSTTIVPTLPPIIPFPYWHMILSLLPPAPTYIRYSSSMPIFPWYLCIIKRGGNYHSNISYTKNISSREVHSTSVMVKHRSRRGGGVSDDILYIIIYYGVDVLQHSSTIQQNLCSPLTFHLLLNIFITGISYLKVFWTPSSSSIVSTGTSIFVIFALIGCIIIFIHPCSSQYTKFKNPNNHPPLSIRFHSHIYLHNCKANMVMVEHCLGFILKVVCMGIRSTLNIPCHSFWSKWVKWGQYQGQWDWYWHYNRPNYIIYIYIFKTFLWFPWVLSTENQLLTANLLGTQDL